MISRRVDDQPKGPGNHGNETLEVKDNDGAPRGRIKPQSIARFVKMLLLFQLIQSLMSTQGRSKAKIAEETTCGCDKQAVSFVIRL